MIFHDILFCLISWIEDNTRIAAPWNSPVHGVTGFIQRYLHPNSDIPIDSPLSSPSHYFQPPSGRYHQLRKLFSWDFWDKKEHCNFYFSTANRGPLSGGFLLFNREPRTSVKRISIVCLKFEVFPFFKNLAQILQHHCDLETNLIHLPF